MQRIVIMLLFILALGLVGCGPEPTATPTPTPDPLMVAAEAGAAMQAVTSLHFVLEHNGVPAYVDAEQTLAFRVAEGDLALPDRIQATVKVLAGGFVAEVRIVAVGDQQWVTNLLTGQWEAVPQGWGLNPAALFDPQVGIPYLMAEELEAERTRLEGPLELEGLEGSFWHVTSVLEGEQLAVLSAGLIPAGPVELEAWIDPSTHLIHRVRLLLPDSDPQEPMEWIIAFSAFDQPVKIKAPGS